MSDLKTAVVAIARLEGNYLKEWVDHYKSLGFSNVIICDNDHDEDDEDIKEILKKDIAGGFVIYEDFRNQIRAQMRCYTMMYEKYKNDYQWLAFLDIDEFIELVNHKDISDFLSDKGDYDCVMLNWLCYGDCDNVLYEAKPLKERFTKPLPIDIKVQYDFPENMHIKSILKGGLPSAVFAANPHSTDSNLKCCNASKMQCNNMPWQPIDYSNAYIKHYITKSTQEFFENKLRRGTGDRDYQSFLYSYSNRYFKYNQVTDKKLNYLKNKGFIK